MASVADSPSGQACTHCGPQHVPVPCKYVPDTAEVLHVILPISNYQQWSTRYHLFAQCYAHMQSLPNIAVYVVEVAIGDRPHVVTQRDNPRHLQLRTRHMLWHKESMINCAIRALLPEGWRYVAWVDADLHFMNRNVGMDTINALQVWDVVQMFQSVCNQGPQGEALEPLYSSFGYQWVQSGGVYAPKLTPRDPVTSPMAEGCYAAGGDHTATHYVAAKDFWHPGFAWACTRRAYKDGFRDGLIDFAILGSGDDHMAKALVGVVDKSFHGRCTEGYKRACLLWQDRALEVIQRNLGYVKGLIVHGYHGRFADRKYVERWSVLTDQAYDPSVDVHRDGVTGLVELAHPAQRHRLRDLIRLYFLQRNEDSR
jgi:hypothetical protein